MHARMHTHAHMEAETHDTQRHTGIADTMSTFHAKFEGDVPENTQTGTSPVEESRDSVSEDYTDTHTHTFTHANTDLCGPMSQFFMKYSSQ